MIEKLYHTRGIALTFLFIIAILLALLLLEAYGDFQDNSPIEYLVSDVNAENPLSCPSGVLVYHLTFKEKEEGTINVAENWCRLDRGCVPSLSDHYTDFLHSSNGGHWKEDLIFRRTIPDHHSMRAGQIWIYTVSSSLPDHPEDESVYKVFFTISDQCEEE